jgi:hypothetical protein
MTLYKLAFGSSNRTIRQKFAQGRSIIQRYNLIICRVFAIKICYSLEILAPPLGKGCIMSFNDFMIFLGFLISVVQLLVLISSCIKNPLNVIPSDYWSHYGFYSVLLQGICDGDKIIWNVHIIVPCGTHDTIHLHQSKFLKAWCKRRY